MARLSLWRENKGNDYKFLDRRISEMFTVGGTGIVLHKYLGSGSDGNTGADATKPVGGDLLSIQDLLFVENRDRKYDTSIYTLRGIYQKADQDFDLSQFGIFLAQGTQFMTFHLNDIVETVGRKIVAGDVLELMHLKDYHSLDDSVPFAIKRYYVVTDASWAAEGFSPTWYPHLWRVKMQPLVDSQEYKDILNKIGASDDPFAANVGSNANPVLSSIVSTYSKYKDINESIIAQAEIELPKSGYDTSGLYVVDKNTVSKTLQAGNGINTNEGNITVNGTTITMTTISERINSNRILVEDSNVAVIGATITTANVFANSRVTIVGILGHNGIILSSNITIGNAEAISFSYNANTTVDQGGFGPYEKIHGYLSGDGNAPDGLSVNMGIAFPGHAIAGDYFLRLDFVPNRLFRYDGRRWVKIEDVVRTDLTPGASDNTTQHSGFVNNTNTWQTDEGRTIIERVSLSKALKADN
jgi:hypothetical protein